MTLSMIQTIGITGGIGSGKSVACRVLETMGVPIYDSDKRAKMLYDESPKLKEHVIELVGNDVYATPDGTLNRALLAQRIFADKALLKAINNLVHPAVREDFCLWREYQARLGNTLCGLESALLLGGELESFVNVRVVVVAPDALRLERAMRRDGATKEAILARMAHQMSQEEMLQRSDFVLYNDSKRPLIPQIWELIDKVETRSY